MQNQAHSSIALRRVGLFAAAIMAGTLLITLSHGIHAQDAPLTVELNKLEAEGQGCRAYFVITNKTDTAYKAIKLDLVLFRPDGVIGRRFAVDLAPLQGNKRSVKLFDIDGTACDQIGSFLVNDVMECKSDAGPIPDCMKGLAVSTLTNVQLTK